jgi:hypothetical protein
MHILDAIAEMSSNQFCMMFSEYMKMQGMEYFKITDVQQIWLIKNHKNKRDKHGMDI